MTIFRKPTVVESYPAYDVVTLEPLSAGGAIHLKADDALGFKRNGFYEKHIISSVASYALKGGDCPMEAIERAKRNGHDLHFIFPTGSCISSTPRAKETLILVEAGQKIKFEGRYFIIERVNNDNLALRETEK